jgi:hypothetical protein
MAGCAYPTGSAGHASRSAQANPELTFKPDHPMGADHSHHLFPSAGRIGRRRWAPNSVLRRQPSINLSDEVADVEQDSHVPLTSADEAGAPANVHFGELVNVPGWPERARSGVGAGTPNLSQKESLPRGRWCMEVVFRMLTAPRWVIMRSAPKRAWRPGSCD